MIWFGTDAQWQWLLAAVADIQNRLKAMGSKMATLDDIRAAVAAETTVEQSIMTLLQQTVAELKTAMASNDPAAMQVVVDSIAANTKALSDAVTANTPVAPTPAPSA